VIKNVLVKPSGMWRVKTKAAVRLIKVLPEFKEILGNILRT